LVAKWKMINHVVPTFSWEPYLCQCCHLPLNAFNAIKIDSTMCTKLAQVSQNPSLWILARTFFALNNLWQ
jgi:hypothetical protein